MEARINKGTGTLLDAGAIELKQDTTYLIKVRYKPATSGGVIQTWVDGVADIDYTGDTTYGADDIKSFRFGRSGAVFDNAYCYIDDVVVSTTDITQNLRIGGKAITGAGTTTQWDPSTGANYECVNEVPPVHTDYNSTNTTNEIDTFALADATESIASIAAVQVELSCAYEGTPTPTHIQHVIRSNGTDYPSTVDKSPPSAFGAPVVHIWETDPQDSGAWTEARLNAIEVGYKATA